MVLAKKSAPMVSAVSAGAAIVIALFCWTADVHSVPAAVGPVLGLTSFVLCLAAFVFGIAGWSTAWRGTWLDRGLVAAGLSLATLVLLFWGFVVLIIWQAALGHPF